MQLAKKEHKTTQEPFDRRPFFNEMRMEYTKENFLFSERLYADNIYVACIQDTNLNSNHRFIIRGYKTFSSTEKEDKKKVCGCSSRTTSQHKN